MSAGSGNYLRCRLGDLPSETRRLAQAKLPNPVPSPATHICPSYHTNTRQRRLELRLTRGRQRPALRCTFTAVHGSFLYAEGFAAAELQARNTGRRVFVHDAPPTLHRRPSRSFPAGGLPFRDAVQGRRRRRTTRRGRVQSRHGSNLVSKPTRLHHRDTTLAPHST